VGCTRPAPSHQAVMPPDSEGDPVRRRRRREAAPHWPSPSPPAPRPTPPAGPQASAPPRKGFRGRRNHPGSQPMGCASAPQRARESARRRKATCRGTLGPPKSGGLSTRKRKVPSLWAPPQGPPKGRRPCPSHPPHANKDGASCPALQFRTSWSCGRRARRARRREPRPPDASRLDQRGTATSLAASVGSTPASSHRFAPLVHAGPAP
jgi:hypothetical protein